MKVRKQSETASSSCSPSESSATWSGNISPFRSKINPN
jgi:hypothetical protein